MSREKEDGPSLETALDRIEEIARQLDRGDLELERALELYEEGISLMRTAEGRLAQAEDRILQLRRVGDEVRTEPFSGGR
jgi:exodeoxyribonuclease VII small subunit